MIAKLGLTSRPEGGHARETWRAEPAGGPRPAGTAIAYLLGADERSRWHRVDATELWLFQGGDPLELSIVAEGTTRPTRIVLGTEVVDDEHPQVLVPASAWRSARTLGSWTLVGRVMSLGLRPEGFEVAPPDWEPGDPTP